mgnify:CR=1 FL=1
MSPMKIVLTPNPYRDKQFRTVQQAKKILDESPHLYELLQEEHRLERAAYQRFRERMK